MKLEKLDGFRDATQEEYELVSNNIKVYKRKDLSKLVNLAMLLAGISGGLLILSIVNSSIGYLLLAGIIGAISFTVGYTLDILLKMRTDIYNKAFKVMDCTIFNIFKNDTNTACVNIKNDLGQECNERLLIRKDTLKDSNKALLVKFDNCYRLISC